MPDATGPSLPNFANPNGIGYFHDMTPQKAGRILVSTARVHAKSKSVKIHGKSSSPLFKGAISMKPGASMGAKK